MPVAVIAQEGSLVTYNYPGDQDDDALGIHSTKYRIWVRQGDGPEEEIEVLQTVGNRRSLTGMPPALEADMLQRTFSYAHVSFDSGEEPLHFRVRRLFPGKIDRVGLHPKSYNLTPVADNTNTEITFSIAEPRKHICINFDGAINRSSNFNWIKEMLLLSVDPPEPEVPDLNDPGVVVYRNDIPVGQLVSADVIYFPPGAYNLYDYADKSDGINEEGYITYNGGIRLRNGQTVYLAGGAYLEGYIFNDNFNDSDQKVIGRGIIDGRQYTWHAADDFDRNGADSRFRAVWQPPNGGDNKLQEFRPANPVALGLNATVEGVMCFTPPHHGVIARDNAKFENVKLVGWHFNNDSYRPNGGSVVNNVFSRAVDDHFYARGIRVTNSVIWPGPNGSIMTTGWASLRIGSARMENIDVVFPEWRGSANDTRTNEGLLMSQNNFNFAPRAMGGTSDPTIYFRNIRFEGTIPRMISLHNGRTPSYDLNRGEPIEGYIGDVVFDNVTVENQLYPALLLGRDDAIGPNGTYTFEIKNIIFRDVEINGECLTEDNRSTYLQERYTDNIRFIGCQTSSTRSAQVRSGLRSWPNPTNGVFYADAPQNQQFRVVNLAGQVLQRGTWMGEGSLEELPNGVYYVQIGNRIAPIVKN